MRAEEMNDQLLMSSGWSLESALHDLYVQWKTLEELLSRVGLSLRPLLPLMLFFVLRPALGQGVVGDGGELETVTTAAESVLATMNSILRVVSIIVVMGCGLAAGFGRMEWSRFGIVFIGLVIANAASTVVEYLGGGVSQT
jgi:type IV secretory pathway VirB2 component (pilin)